jgi:hypothetical protein
MGPVLVAAVIAAAVSAAGWVVNYILSSKLERERTRQAARLTHVQNQLERLYGPLAFLVYEGRKAFNDVWEKFGGQAIFTGDRELSQEELDLWLFWVDNEFIPRNTKIEQLLSANTHLIPGKRLPDSYIKFLDHHIGWHMEHLRWTEGGTRYSWHSKINWPKSFEDEVLSTFEDLMEEHAALIGSVGGSEAASRPSPNRGQGGHPPQRQRPSQLPGLGGPGG